MTTDAVLLAGRLRALFTVEVLQRLKRAPKSESLDYRLRVLTGEGLDDGPQRDWQVRYCEAQRTAWAEYTDAAEACGLFDDPHGAELASRLTGVHDENFRSAMAECTAAWYLSRKLGLEVSARPLGRGNSELELLAMLPDGEVHVEVKSPFREGIFDGFVHHLDDSDILDRCVVDASKQFKKSARNLLMLVGRMTLGIRARHFFIDAFYARRTFAVTKNLTTRTTGAARTVFDNNGRFLKVWPGEKGPRHTRISGVLYVEEHIRDRPETGGTPALRAEHDVLMFHNPNALLPLPAKPWGDCPQLVPRSGVMEWTDGEDV